MKYRLIVLGLILSVIAVTLSGVYAMRASEKVLASFEKREKNFKVIATAATEVSSYAKRAEGHLFLYLALHREQDREKFPKRVASLFEQISILDAKINIPEARVILDRMKSGIKDMLPIGNGLIASHDRALSETGRFDLEEQRETIFKLHEQFAEVRRLGVDLAALEIKVEDSIKAEVRQKALRLQSYILVFIGLVSCLTLYLGFVLIRMIGVLKKEVSIRMQSEEKLLLERDRLEEALAKVKTLRGLIPICASCKKIRDDSGYWNQIENYIRRHSDAEFSHGICPECADRYYSEIHDKKK